MKTAFAIFWRDLKRIAKNPVALIVTIGVAIVPAMYAWFNVAASWDPYGNTANIKVAVVNADKGATDDLVGELNAGKLVIDALKENRDLGWVYDDESGAVLTENSAKSGVESGKYYAAIVVPENFSESLLTITSGTYTKPNIIYYVNEKHNTVAPEITNVGAETIQTQISEEFIGTVSGVVADKLEDIVTNAEDTTSSATSTIASKINEAASSLSSSADGLSELGNTLSSSRSATSDAKSSLSDLKGMISDSQTTLSDATNQLASVRNASSDLQNSISSNLGKVNTALGKVAGTASTDIGKYAGQIAISQGKVQGALASVQAIIKSNEQLISEIQAVLDKGGLSDDVKAKLNETLGELQNLNSSLNGIVDSLSGTSSKIEDYSSSISQNTEQINSTVQGQITTIATDSSELVNSVFPALNSALDTFSHASGNLSGVLSSLSPTLTQAQNILDELDVTLEGASSSISGLRTSLGNVAGTLERVATDISTISLAELTDELKEDLGTDLNADAQSVASFMVSPVEINTEVMYEVEKYGAAAAPFYTNLAIWVGGFVLIAIYKQEVDREGLDAGVRPHTAYLGRLMLYLLIGQLQAIIVCVGDVVMGIQCVSPVAFVFAGMVQSFVYVNIIFALAVAFKHIGKALAVVIVILQIPGSSGLYPIEMMPDFFRNIEPWLPFTYGIRAMRESIAGFYGNHYAVALLQLLAFTIPALLLGMAARRRLININALFDDRLRSTELMVCEHESLASNSYGLRAMVRMLRETNYSQKAKEKAANFERLYPMLAKWGVRLLVIIPAGLLVLLFAIDAKDVVLNIWVWSCILLCSALIVLEYMHDNLERKNDLAYMSDDEVRTLLDTKLKGGE